MLTAQDHSNIRVTIRPIVAARAAAVQDALDDGILALQLVQKGSRRLLRYRIKR